MEKDKRLSELLLIEETQIKGEYKIYEFDEEKGIAKLQKITSDREQKGEPYHTVYYCTKIPKDRDEVLEDLRYGPKKGGAW